MSRVIGGRVARRPPTYRTAILFPDLGMQIVFQSARRPIGMLRGWRGLTKSCATATMVPTCISARPQATMLSRAHVTKLGRD